MPKVFLSDIESNPSEAEVDKAVLTRGDSQNPTDLTDEQVSRLEDSGVKLEKAEPDEIDKLKGQALDDALAAADLDVPSDAKADDKRQALRDHAASGGSD